MRDLTDHYLAHPDERAGDGGARPRRAPSRSTPIARRMEDLLAAVIGPAQEHLLGRRRTVTVGDVARAAATATARALPRPLRPRRRRSRSIGLAASLADREGALAEPEAIFLFLHQFDELYLREHRR